MHNSVRRPPLRAPMIGDMGRQYKRVHGVGIVVLIAKPEDRRIEYEVKWLKSDERMRFNEEDLIIISDVDRQT